MNLVNFEFDTFLAEYWQKKPLLIRNPWDRWHNPIGPDELAGLACEDDVEARLITQSRARARALWKAEHGPFPEDRFGKLGKKPYTLLVQAVDHHVPDVAALIAPFRFVPNWRVDDVMVSYANDQGGVGPHFDQYDVFLIQGLGRRRWQVGGACDASTPLMTHDEFQLLADFQPVEEWVLEPGDILYVPPRIAHNGVALGEDCMTYSIGFRAPSRSELIAHWSDHLLDTINDDDRYEDPGLRAQANPGEISADAIASLHAMIAQSLHDRDGFVRWFGRFNSTRKYPDIDWRPEEPVEVEQLRACLASGMPLQHNPASRFSFVRQDAGAVLLFVDGESFDCGPDTAGLAEAICADDTIIVGGPCQACDSAMDLIAALYNQGSVAFEPESED